MRDGFDITSAVIHNSHDVKSWPATATITKLEFRSSGVHVEHTKNQGPGAWPNFRPPGWDGDLQYTLWIFLNLNGWQGSGCIEFWQSCDQNGGPPEQFAKNWYYAADRWAPMTGHQPSPGEMVGFMVSAGDARNNGAQSVQERSTIVLMPFPSSGTVYTGQAAPEPAPEPVPTPTPVPDNPPDPSGTLAEKLAQMLELFNELLEHYKAQETRIAAVEAKQAIVQPAAWHGPSYKIPLVGTTIKLFVDTPMTAEQLAAYKAAK